MHGLISDIVNPLTGIDLGLALKISVIQFASRVFWAGGKCDGRKQREIQYNESRCAANLGGIFHGMKISVLGGESISSQLSLLKLSRPASPPP